MGETDRDDARTAAEIEQAVRRLEAGPVPDPREEHPLKSQGVWSGTAFARMFAQHRRLKDKFPDWEPAQGMPYEDVENMRPETKKMVDMWLKTYGDAKDVILGIEAAGN